MCTNSLYKTFGEVFIDFWTLGYPFHGLFGPYRCLWNRELRGQTEARMMHFITLTVPPPRTDHSLMHNSTRGRSPGQKGLQVRFRENVSFGPCTRFSALESIFLQYPGCAQTPFRRHLARFSLIFGP
jgi:hypothetical protein